MLLFTLVHYNLDANIRPSFQVHLDMKLPSFCKRDKCDDSTGQPSRRSHKVQRLWMHFRIFIGLPIWGYFLGDYSVKCIDKHHKNSETYPLITFSQRRRCPLQIAHLDETSSPTPKYIPFQILWSSKILTREKAGTGECLAYLPDKGFKRIQTKCTLHQNWFNLGFFWTQGP